MKKIFFILKLKILKFCKHRRYSRRKFYSYF